MDSAPVIILVSTGVLLSLVRSQRTSTRKCSFTNFLDDYERPARDRCPVVTGLRSHRTTAYFRAGVCCVLASVISTPLRNVGWTFAGEVWRVASLNGTIWNDCLLQYNGVLLNDEVRQLRGVAYAYAL
ncbi:hypothetical protein PF004_g21911 [Phytophthora fragariae]|uniref:Secreted protein n=1 Tax=Phytophthora fragariae TaxID=53985 RepID=A0A6A3IIK1_9STRA|nr:hypothetical protein PF011_g21864 [Phytophthora fragariae]KAE9190403.1 hypothetical protein PF004_g21911 [Phytophthora fragariae]